VSIHTAGGSLIGEGPYSRDLILQRGETLVTVLILGHFAHFGSRLAASLWSASDGVFGGFAIQTGFCAIAVTKVHGRRVMPR